jgi:hypothetical protein
MERSCRFKKEHLVQVTRCTATQTIQSFYCGFQSHAWVKRYEKFHELIVIKPAVVVNLIGGLDNNGNCEVGLFEVNGVPLRSQVAIVAYEIYVWQEWARANDLTSSMNLSEYLMGTTTDRMLVNSGEGTYILDYSQDACPDTLVSLYRGSIKVLTNSTATYTDSTAIVAGREKNQVAGLELKETMILCG